MSVDNRANPRMIKVRIKVSKTDPFRLGVDIFMGKTGNEICPVAAMLAYLIKRGNKEGMLFHFIDGNLLTRERFVTPVKRVLSAAGVDCNPYSGHSFRIGAATTAGRKGVPPATIKTLGRWESAAYMLYMRLPRDELAKISTVIFE